MEPEVYYMFTGFSNKTFAFLKGLGKNNNKEWFDSHRSDYETNYMAPAKLFVEALGQKLKKIEPAVQYEAKVNKSIFRINRDVRFSKDKTPYKDHIDLWFWLGGKKGWDTGGFFIRITHDKLILGAGIHAFEKERTAAFRKAVISDSSGEALTKLIKKLQGYKYAIGGATRKTVPRGFDGNHRRASLLLHEGLVVMLEGKHPKEIQSGKFTDYCLGHFKKMSPLNSWLGNYTK